MSGQLTLIFPKPHSTALEPRRRGKRCGRVERQDDEALDLHVVDGGARLQLAMAVGRARLHAILACETREKPLVNLL